jgi:hypothetical protein
MAALTSSGGATVGGGEVVDVDEPRLVQALKTGNLKAVDDILAGSASLTINSLLGNQVRFSIPPSPSFFFECRAMSSNEIERRFLFPNHALHSF